MDLAALLPMDVMHSAFLLPTLLGMVVLDAPFPMVPSEAALMSAYGLAVGAHAWLLVAGLYATALAGAVTGDLLMWRLGRGSRRMPVENALTRWVAENIERRPGAVIVGARFLPGGRLVSTLAAGRYGMPIARFLPWSLLTSSAWALYMLLMGLVLAPLIGGDPLRGLVAGLAMAALVGGLVQLVRRLRDGLRTSRQAVRA
jgi:membrane-associated protein